MRDTENDWKLDDQLKHNQALAVNLTEIAMRNENLQLHFTDRGDDTFHCYARLLSKLQHNDKLRKET